MKRVQFASTATFELTDAVRSYNLTRPGLGEEFLVQVERALATVAEHPASAAIVVDTFRRAVIRQFPFCLVYRELEDSIQVLAVFPTRADPERLLQSLTTAPSNLAS